MRYHPETKNPSCHSSGDLHYSSCILPLLEAWIWAWMSLGGLRWFESRNRGGAPSVSKRPPPCACRTLSRAIKDDSSRRFAGLYGGRQRWVPPVKGFWQCSALQR